MKKIFFFQVIIFIFTLLQPKASFADNSPPNPPPLQCGFSVTATNNTTGEVKPVANNTFLNVFDQLTVIFNLGSIPENDWSQFSDVKPSPDGNKIPDILENKISMIIPDNNSPFPWSIINDLTGGCSNDFPPELRVKSAVLSHTFTLETSSCPFLKNPGTFHAVLKFYSSSNKEIILCQNQFEVMDSTQQGADIEVTSTTGLGDIDSPWKVVIDDVAIPKSWRSDRYLVYLDFTELKSQKYYKDPRILDAGNLNNHSDSRNYNTTDHEVTFTLKPFVDQAGPHTISLYSVDYTLPFPVVQHIVDKEFPVVAKGQSTPTPIPTKPIPSQCVRPGGPDTEPECKPDASGKPGGCIGNCIFCPGCPKSSESPKRDLTKVRPLCEQIGQGAPSDKCFQCINGVGDYAPPKGPGVWTAIGCIPTDVPTMLTQYVWPFGLGLAGGVAFLYFLFGSFKILTSMGNPEAINEGKEIMVSAISGLLLIIFSILLLGIIGVDILRIPGFGNDNKTPQTQSTIPRGTFRK